ncbi:hypothetical protein O4J56_30255 [Nocardiopsis sp. RSe5-2]|uniref:Uncharacterized protein n=1 Tax=Nocardiopsis endophytica TaxID=3018445 RepID=A0ABT4UDC9_9ACTN|nr:hypothetical protein [Nocardiopsis endophytica]MDA2814966.1 hypothetical protein [Nocardiopsis endophytica]
MSALNALKGCSLEGTWVDVPGHSVTLSLRSPAGAVPALTYTLVLEGVTDFSFFDEGAAPWPGAEVADVGSDHDEDSMRLDFSFGGEASGLAVTCGKVLLHRTRDGEP